MGPFSSPDTYFFFFMYTEVDPFTILRSVSNPETFHSGFGRKWKIQEFVRSRLASWDIVLELLAKHEERIKDMDDEDKEIHQPKFLRLQMAEGKPVDVLLEFPQEYTEDLYTQIEIEMERNRAKQLWEEE